MLGPFCYKWGISCKMDVSLDGITFIPCQEDMIIYDNKIKATNVNPKCASYNG